MRFALRIRALLPLSVAFAALLVGTGCKDDEQAQEAPAGEGTAGGEQPAGTPGTGAGEAPAPDDEGMGMGTGEGAGTGGGEAGEGAPAAGEGEPSPWGKTRAEQCKPPSRKTVNASAQQAIARGKQAARSGNTSAARQAFQQALEADPNAYPAAYNLGVMADRAGQDAQALEQYRRALRIQPDYEQAARGIVSIHLRRGDVDAARRFTDALASQFSTNLAVQALHAETLVQAGRFDEAWQAARKALACDERFVPAMIALVKASMKQGRKELAESVLDQALDIEQDNAELQYLKARMLLDEEGRLRDALTHLRKAIELRPSYLEARMLLGIQLLSGGNYEQALQHFQAAAELAPKLVAVHLNLGDAYRANQQWQKAKQAFDKALQMEPELPEAHFNMALMYMAAGEGFPGLNALQALEKAKEQFQTYRNMMGPRLPRDDPSEQYLADLDRQIERTKRRIEREKARKQREAERAARQQAEGGQGEGETAGGGGDGGGGQQ